MSNVRDEARYTKSHEWVAQESEFEALCGITDHAQEMLTDIVFVELPDAGTTVEAGEQIAVVESVKAVSDVFAPVSGQIVAINSELEDAPELVNSDPYGEGWLFRIEIKNPEELDELMTADEYIEFSASGE